MLLSCVGPRRELTGLLQTVAQTLDSLLTQLSGVQDIGVLFNGLDVAVNEVLLGLETLLAGVLNLVAQLQVSYLCRNHADAQQPRRRRCTPPGPRIGNHPRFSGVVNTAAQEQLYIVTIV